ncbi:MAG: NfeD family protein [Fusobacterium sp.]|nr:NfeD family protein [Fusobacterium sp.]
MFIENYLIWTALVLVFSVIEIVIPSLVSVWFAIASGLTIPIALIFINFRIEFPFFVLCSIFLILFTRPYAKKYLDKNKEDFSSSMVGSSVKILKFNFTENSTYFYDVKFKGSVWTAISSDEFSKDDVATIVEFQGNKIVIKK